MNFAMKMILLQKWLISAKLAFFYCAELAILSVFKQNYSLHIIKSEFLSKIIAYTKLFRLQCAALIFHKNSRSVIKMRQGNVCDYLSKIK